MDQLLSGSALKREREKLIKKSLSSFQNFDFASIFFFKSI